MSDRGLRYVWNRLRAMARRKNTPAPEVKEEPRPMLPFLLDAKWIVEKGYADKMNEAYTTKGLMEILKAIEPEPSGAWKVLVWNLVATVRVHTKAFHEQTAFIVELQDEIAKAKAGLEQEKKNAKRDVEEERRKRNEAIAEKDGVVRQMSKERDSLRAIIETITAERDALVKKARDLEGRVRVADEVVAKVREVGGA